MKKATDLVIDTERETRESDRVTVPPPGADEPMASLRYFQRLDDETTGESINMLACQDRLLRVWSALNNRELRPEKGFYKSIFLLPFPTAKDERASMKVYAFDHSDNLPALEHIAADLMALTSFKDGAAAENSTREGRINLIKALTEYFESLMSNPVAEDLPMVDLNVDYSGALEMINKLDFDLILDGKRLPKFRDGREFITITPESAAEFKQELASYFLANHKAVKTSPDETNAERIISGIRKKTVVI